MREPSPPGRRRSRCGRTPNQTDRGNRRNPQTADQTSKGRKTPQTSTGEQRSTHHQTASTTPQQEHPQQSSPPQSRTLTTVETQPNTNRPTGRKEEKLKETVPVASAYRPHKISLKTPLRTAHTKTAVKNNPPTQTRGTICNDTQHATPAKTHFRDCKRTPQASKTVEQPQGPAPHSIHHY